MPSSWGPTRSGKGWTCRAARCARLVLCKLPFKVPSEPITAARLERLAEQGEDGFMGYLLPHAALKLKQGFGRLIRSRSDVGVVVLLDSRVLTKRYGALLLVGTAARPIGSIGPWSQVRTRCEDFFARHGIGAEALGRDARHRRSSAWAATTPTHAKELGNAVPERPLLFLKPPTAIIGRWRGDHPPPQSTRVEHEAEIGGGDRRSGSGRSPRPRR